MKFALLSPGTGSYYCGACMRDNALAKGLHEAGHEVSLLPMYLPLELDEATLPQAKEPPIFFGGINVFLQQKVSLFRYTPRWMDRLLNGKGLLRAAAKRSHMTSAREHGEMALAMLRLEESNLTKELEKLIDWLAQEQPEVVSLSTTLQAGMIRALKERLGVKVICSFQGEDSFLDGLPEPYRTECWQEMGVRLRDADLVVAPSRFYAELMKARLGMPDLRIEVLPNGIDLTGYDLEVPKEEPPAIGYLARMIPEKGVGIMVDAYIHLRTVLGVEKVQMKLAGTATAEDEALVVTLQRKLADAGLGGEVTWATNISREEKIVFLKSLSLFSVPAIYPEAFGLYLAEALAAGVPLVQPAAASFVEVLGQSQAGVLVAPNDAVALAEGWRDLLADPTRRKVLGECGRRAAEESYSMAAMRERFLKLVKGV
jgi:glycosyltransferase involved in cell wall biosynthesis